MVDHSYRRKRSKEDYGWHRRGYLPHIDGSELYQFITFRLFDSLPKSVLEKWMKEGIADSLMRKRIERYLDSGYGACWLKDPAIAKIVRDSIFYFAGERYKLISWVIMPNHVHLLLALRENEHLPEILHSIKSYSAQKANQSLGRKGQFWMHESFDRYIRDLRHYTAVIRYIENNPVKARLCEKPEDWVFSSAYDEHDVK